MRNIDSFGDGTTEICAHACLVLNTWNQPKSSVMKGNVEAILANVLLWQWSTHNDGRVVRLEADSLIWNGYCWRISPSAGSRTTAASWLSLWPLGQAWLCLSKRSNYLRYFHWMVATAARWMDCPCSCGGPNLGVHSPAFVRAAYKDFPRRHWPAYREVPLWGLRPTQLRWPCRFVAGAKTHRRRSLSTPLFGAAIAVPRTFWPAHSSEIQLQIYAISTLNWTTF